tara:strand:+ start:328 stop:546 length:219 start_codon:yes stop_codon:yes gene_type:complete
VTKATKIVLVVGTILALINHGESIFSSSISGHTVMQIILTYFVPYTVSTNSTVAIILKTENTQIDIDNTDAP